jgi:hypothetical protein
VYAVMNAYRPLGVGQRINLQLSTPASSSLTQAGRVALSTREIFKRG